MIFEEYAVPKGLRCLAAKGLAGKEIVKFTIFLRAPVAQAQSQFFMLRAIHTNFFRKSKIFEIGRPQNWVQRLGRNCSSRIQIFTKPSQSLERIISDSETRPKPKPPSGLQSLFATNYHLEESDYCEIRESLLKTLLIPECSRPRFLNLDYVEQDVKDTLKLFFSYCLHNMEKENKEFTWWHLYGPLGSGRTRFAFELIPILQKFAAKLKDGKAECFNSARIIYVNLTYGHAAPSRSGYENWSVEARLSLHLICTYWFPSFNLIGVAELFKEQQSDIPSLEMIFDQICAEPNPPKVIHIVLDDADELACYTSPISTNKHLLKEYMKLLAPMQQRYSTVTLIPMVITAKGPSLLQTYLKASAYKVNHVEMKPMSTQTLIDIIKQDEYRLFRQLRPLARDSTQFMFLLDGNPGLAEMKSVAFTTPETSKGLLMAPITYKWPVGGCPDIFMLAALSGYPVDMKVRFFGRTVKSVINLQIFRHRLHEPFGKCQILSTPLIALEKSLYQTYPTDLPNHASDIFHHFHERGPQWFEKLCSEHQHLRFNVANCMAVKLKTHISFIDLFGDAFASEEMKSTFMIRPTKCFGGRKPLNSNEQMDEWLNKLEDWAEQIMLPDGHENTSVIKCHRSDDHRACWLWLRVVRKPQDNMTLDAHDIQQTTHPALPSNDQFTVVISNGRAFSDLANVIGPRTVVICDDNLSTSFSDVLTPLVRNLDVWEQLKRDK